MATALIRSSTTAAKLLLSTSAAPFRSLASYSPNTLARLRSDLEAWSRGFVADGNGVRCRRFEWSSDEDGTYYRMDMPGISETQVKASLVGNDVIEIVGTGSEILGSRSCHGFIPLDEGASYNFDGLKITVHYGVVRVVIPKYKKK